MNFTRCVGAVAAWSLLSGAAPRPTLSMELESVLEQDLHPPAPELSYQLDGLEAPFQPPDQLAAQAEAMLHAGRYDEAQPLLEALAAFSGFELHASFMSGYSALKRGEPQVAARQLERAVEINPDYSRARVELGQALMALGRTREADRQFEIAERDRSLPPEIRELVRENRRTTAERARWHLNVDAALIADTNLESPAGAGARREGVGAGAAASGGVRLRVAPDLALAFDSEIYWNGYGGGTPDDFSLFMAAGPEVRSDEGLFTLQALAYSRWYGDLVSASGVGLRGRGQHQVGSGQRVYLLVDARIVDSDYGDSFSGWQANGLLIYEHSLSDGLSLNGTLYARREWLGSDVFSYSEFGAYAGASLRLPLNLQASVTGGAVRAIYDAPFLRFSAEPRHDWRLSGSLHLALRDKLPGGLWPSLSYHYIATNSSLAIYESDRQRLRFNFRRPF